MEAATTASLPHLDELVMEYLLFRGFTKSFQAFNVERKRDRVRGFDVEQLITQMLGYVQNYQIESILETWRFLSARFFSRMDSSYATTIQQLETSWLRLYVVNAVKTGHREKAIEFFKLMLICVIHANKLNATVSVQGNNGDDSWSRWFILPYIQQPDTDTYFKSFFTKEWLEGFVTSFRNFLSLVFRNLPLPRLLAFQISRLEEPSLKLRLKVSQSECTRLRLFSVQAEERIRKLEEASRQLYEMLRSMVQVSFAESFASSGSLRSGGLTPLSQPSDVVMSALSDQLRQLSTILRDGTHSPDNNQKMLDPLHVRLVQASTATAVESKHPSFESNLLRTPLSHSPTGQGVVVGEFMEHEDDGELLIDDLNEASSTELVNESNGTCAYSSDGKLLAISSIESVRVFNVESSAATEIPAPPTIKNNIIVRVDWIGESKTLLYVLSKGAIALWDTESHTITSSKTIDLPAGSFVSDAVISRQGHCGLVIDGNHSRVELLSVEQNVIEMTSTINAGSASITSADWSSQSSFLALGRGDGSALLYDVSSFSVIKSWPVTQHQESSTHVAFGAGIALFTVSNLTSVVTEWALFEENEEMTASQPRVLQVYQIPQDLEVNHARKCLWADQAERRFIIACLGHDGENVLALFENDKPPTVFSVAAPVADVSWHPSPNVCAILTTDKKVILWRKKGRACVV